MDLKYLLLLTLLALICFAHTQAQSGYYVTAEGQRLDKIKLRNQGPIVNAKECQQILSEFDNLTLLPQQLTEYGFNMAHVYHSKMIIIEEEPTQVFLRLLVDGNMRLFYYSSKWRKRFFVENEEGGLIEIVEFDPSDDSYDFKQALRSLCRDCVPAVEAVDEVKFSQASLSRFVEKFNACDERPLPKPHYGTFVGWNLSTLVAGHAVSMQILQEAEFSYDGTFTVGGFVDLPIPARNLFLHVEAYYSYSDFWYEKITENYDTDVVVNLSSISLPLMLRYTSPNKKIRPFFDVGLTFARFLKNNSGIQQSALQNGDTLSTYIINEEPIFDNFQISAGIGGGVLVQLNNKLAVFAEARFHNFSIWVPTKQRLFRREIMFQGGLRF
ncbi:MAG: porin family protein [Bacteroidota bacterium]